MLTEEIQKLITKQLRVREPLAARELAGRTGLSTRQLAKAINNLVEGGVAVKHAGSTRRGDRAPRYTKAAKPKS